MKIIGVIPARYDSTRLPGKPLAVIKGKTMIQRVYEQSTRSIYLDKVIVATDNKKIFKCVKDFGGEVVMTSVRHKSGTDRISEAVKRINCDVVVNIQGDEPFIDPKNIDNAIQPLIDSESVKVSTLAVRINDIAELLDENKVKVVFDKNKFALYFSRSFIPYDMKHNPQHKWALMDNKYFKHIGLYVFRKKYLMKFCKMKNSYLEKMEKLEQLRILEDGEKIKVVITKKDSFSIDTPEDLDLINKL